MIYILQPIGGGPIKIGHSLKPHIREKQIKSLFPYGVEVLTMFKGARIGEKFLHLCFSPFATSAEWFLPKPEVWRLIIDIIDNGRPGFLPTEEQAKTEELDALALSLFGDRKAVAVGLGLSRTTTYYEAIQSSSSVAYAAKARLTFAKALRDRALPDYIMALHEDAAPSFAEAAE